MTFDAASIDELSRREIVLRQTGLLRALVEEIVPRNPFWSARFAAAGLRPQDIREPADLRLLPLTAKAEIVADQRSTPPYGANLTYAPDLYSRLHQTSGTTGAPMRWIDTPESWNWVMRCWQQLFGLMGLRKEDRLFFAFSFGPFLGFWAGFEGASRLGNLCIPAGGMSSLARLQLMLDNRATVLCCTPTYALRLAETAAQEKIDLRSSAVRAILVAGEPGGNIPATRRRIEETWQARVVDHWGMTELGPLAIEPENSPGGLSMLETECIVEIIDPETHEPVADGNEGELVVTNLGRTGSPLLRYRTGDRVRRQDTSGLVYLPGGILGRTDEMVTIRGNNLYPAALEDAIREFPEVLEFRVVLHTRRAMQHVRIELDPDPQCGDARMRSIVATLHETIKDRWHFQAEIVVVAPGALPRFEMKARRVVRVDDDGCQAEPQ